MAEARQIPQFGNDARGIVNGTRILIHLDSGSAIEF
jgi:hypothetical protein